MKRNLWLAAVTCLAYCLDQELWKAIEYLKEQVRVLEEQQEKDKRILLDNRRRMRLAAKAKRLTRELLEQTTVLFTSDTIMAWYRRLIAQKYDGSKNRKHPGRPKTSQEILDLVIRFKQENLRLSSGDGTTAKRWNSWQTLPQESGRVGPECQCPRALPPYI